MGGSPIHKPRLIIDQFKKRKPSYVATKIPIVLCHGLLGFDHIDLPGYQIAYFRGVKKTLEEHGARVFACSVPPMASIELRAASLCKSLRELRCPSANIIAHSMGGLDARYLISKLGNESPEIASLTTLSTPHRGSPIADFFKGLTQHFPPRFSAFQELTTSYMNDVFNNEVQDSPNVKYFSYGARTKPQAAPLFYLTGKYIQEREGDNDGMVSVMSAMWGDYLGTLENVSHAEIINMTTFQALNPNYDAGAMYLQIMEDLAEIGL